MDANQTNMDVPFVPSCPGCVAAAKRIAELEKRDAEREARIAVLERKVEELSRSAKRQAAPFSRGLPKSDPKKPGRKSGDDYGTVSRRTVPDHIDETHEAPLPRRCPNCGNNAFIDTHVEQQYQVEIPRRPIYRQFNVGVGQCTCCRRRVQGRHPLQTSDALGCCASQVGPEAQAAVVLLNKELGLSWGKISRFFRMLFGIGLSRGGGCQIMLRGARRCEPTYQAIIKHVQHHPSLVPDETGWRIGGSLAWLHVAVTQDAVAYLIARQRGFEASALLIGADYQGSMTHDGWRGYERFLLALHQTCNDHLIRRCREMMEQATAAAAIFPRQVMALLHQGLAARDRRNAGQITLQAAAAKAAQLERRMEALTAAPRRNPANERLAKHLWRNLNSLFTYLKFQGIDATNHKAEQAIRPAVVNRKVWGGNRTQAGATAQSILMSVIFTVIKNGHDALEFVSQTLRSLPEHRPKLLAQTG
jgi:transposase